jgi:putative ABC transport system ATP-binding protein
MSESLIRAEGIEKVYRLGKVQVPALRGVDLEIERGEYVAITGPSGSGKSTLMHILGCLDTPTTGGYWLDGERVSALRGRALARVRNRKVGFVFQNFNLLARLDIVENVALPLRYRGGLSRRDRPDELSGGQRQRVAIARALVTDPAMLLADEPTGNLDTETSREILGVFRELHAAGRTILLVTHEIEVAAEASREIHLRDGRLANGAG